MFTRVVEQDMLNRIYKIACEDCIPQESRAKFDEVDPGWFKYVNHLGVASLSLHKIDFEFQKDFKVSS